MPPSVIVRPWSLTASSGIDRVRILQDLEPRLGAVMRDERRAGVLERLAAGGMVEVVVAVDDVADRLVGDLADLGEVDLGRRSAGRSRSDPSR